jgi:hypothetical protein
MLHLSSCFFYYLASVSLPPLASTGHQLPPTSLYRCWWRSGRHIPTWTHERTRERTGVQASGSLRPHSAARIQSRRWINPDLELVDPLGVTHSLGGFNSLAEPIPLFLFCCSVRQGWIQGWESDSMYTYPGV